MIVRGVRDRVRWTRGHSLPGLAGSRGDHFPITWRIKEHPGHQEDDAKVQRCTSKAIRAT